jgi:hypothetical protein
MHSIVSQDWVTIRGQSASEPATITQGTNGWLELAAYQDVVAWLDVRELTLSGGTVQMAYQTAPSADESLFAMMSGPLATVPFSPSVGVTVTTLLKQQLTAPLARWFRWQLTTSGTFSTAWDITFRLFLSANVLGMNARGARPISHSSIR